MIAPGIGGQEREALLFRAIVDSSDDAIISKDLSGIITSWNTSAERLFGYTAAEAIGQPVTMLMPPDRLDEEPQILSRLKRGERVNHFETVRRRKDGSLMDISLTISPVRDREGNIVGASKIARDITGSKLADRGVRLLSSIIDSSEDAIVSKDLNGIITSWNKSAERLFGYTAAEAIGQPVTMLIPPDRLDEEPHILSRLKRGERVDHFETVRQRKDGSLLEISLTISPMKDREGNIVGASKIARDITESKRVEAELRRANHDLEQFAFSASHDLQEPLRALKIYSELLTKHHSGKLNGEALGFLTQLRAGAMRMEKLVRDLLAYTQVMKFQKPAERVAADEAVATVLQSLENPIKETAANISTEVLPSVQMHPAHLQQLFQNLIGNAIKYRHRKRPPAVRITAARQIGQWVFTISDNGIGIASEYKEHIFGLFKRLHSDTEYSGTGIGLAICKRIVEQYNGRIWVESEPEQGSVFRFTVPD